MSEEHQDTRDFIGSLAGRANNRAWDLADMEKRSEAEEREMLINACAAYYLWQMAGTTPEKARAAHLMGHVDALRGDTITALEFTNRYLTYSEREGELWELPMAYAARALALYKAGHEGVRDYIDKAREAVKAVEDHDERQIANEYVERVAKLVGVAA